MGKQTLYATLPDGRVVMRTTDRDYKFLVCVRWVMDDPLVWTAFRWSSTEKLAHQGVLEAHRHGAAAEVKIVPVTVGPPKQRKKRAPQTLGLGK